MNQPDRYSNFVFAEGVEKCEFKLDTRLQNAATFTFRAEDHTMGNLVRMQLHEDDRVIFAGYRIPHPLEPKMVVRVQTTDNYTPEDAVINSLNSLGEEFHSFLKEFDEQKRVFREAEAYKMATLNISRGARQ